MKLALFGLLTLLALQDKKPAPITDPEAAETYDAEGNNGPELDENASEDEETRPASFGSGGREKPDNDSPLPSPESSAPTPEPTAESNPEPAE